MQDAAKRWPADPNVGLPYASTLSNAGDFKAGEAVISGFAGATPDGHPLEAILMARYYTATGHTGLAVEPLTKALASDPSSISTRTDLLQVLSALHDWDKALKVAEDAPQPAAGNAAAGAAYRQLQSLRVQTLLGAGRPNDAASAARSQLASRPDDAVFLNLLAEAQIDSNELDAASATIQKALKAEPENAGANHLHALLALRSHPPDADIAIKDLVVVVDRDPGNVSSANTLADAYLMKGDFDDAAHALEAVLRVAPENKDIRLKLVDLYSKLTPPRWTDATRVLETGLAYPQFKDDPDLLRTDAVVWAHRGEGDKAIAIVRRALAAAPNRHDLVQDYLNILLLTKNYDQLLSESQPLLSNPPVPWWAYTLRAEAKAQSGDPKGATDEFDLALSAAGAASTPANTSAITSVIANIVAEMGVEKAADLVEPRTGNSLTWKLAALPLMERANNAAAAEQMADSVVAAADTLPADQEEIALQSAGSIYLTADPPLVKKAVSTYQLLLEKRPGNFVALNNLAYLLTEMVKPPQPEQALKYSQSAFDAVQKSGRIQPLIYDTQGWTLILAGRIDEGINVLQQAIDQSPLPELHYHLAEGYLKKQMPTDAQSELLAADDIIEKEVARHQKVDSALKGKISEALKAAEKMSQAKTDTR